MAYDEGLAERIGAELGRRQGVTERKMFGGLCFMVNGNMCAGVVGNELMVRVGRDAYAEALLAPHAREMDFTGRPMRGMVFVDADGLAEDQDLTAWLDRGRAFAASLPSKR